MSVITLSPTAAVREALQAAFPRSNTERALKKYINTLQGLINTAVLNGRSAEEQKLDLYSISLHALTHQGGQIGTAKVRMHTWLAKNVLEMVSVATRGSNLTGRVSQVKLTRNVIVERIDVDELALTNMPLSHVAQIATHYPDLLHGDIDAYAALHEYDVVPVATDALRSYIDWLRSQSCSLRNRQQETELKQALHVLGEAQRLDGMYLQKKKPSVFGRTYYHGVSVQSVSKSLRRAMLGRCWEYDMRSSVVAWKLGFAKDCCAASDESRDVGEVFAFSFCYLYDKAPLIRAICEQVFDANSRCAPERQVKLIKQALTAISFGARKNTAAWQCQDGTRRMGALATIFSDAEERQRFIQCKCVQDFMEEQRQLDSYIARCELEEKSALRNHASLHTPRGRLSKPKLLAMLYQNAETRVMNKIDWGLREKGYKVIGRIHDAIITSTAIPEALLASLLDDVRAATRNEYWHLCETAHEPFVLAGSEKDDRSGCSEDALGRIVAACQNDMENDMAHLTSLKLVNASRNTQLSPQLSRREKLLRQIDEQIVLAQSEIDDKPFAATVKRKVTNAEGVRETVVVPKRVKAWWWVTEGGKYALAVRYGTKVLSLAKNANAIEVAEKKGLVVALAMVKKAVEAGELDAAIEAAAASRVKR